MRNRIYLLILLLHTICVSTVFGATRYALLIGIGEYPRSSGWTTLSGERDVELMRDVLMKQGFMPEHIFTVQGRHATHAGIWKALAEMEDRLQPGDMLVFHFSGHGQQVVDVSGDEADKLDEAIVPYDSPLTYTKDVYEGESLILDDELRSGFVRMRRTLEKSGHLLVLIDACHSGTATRGFTTSRGTHQVMGDPETVAAVTAVNRSAAYASIDLFEEQLLLAPMVAFYSSSPFQQSYEYRSEDGLQYGSLTYAFARRIEQLPANATYARLYEAISTEIASWWGNQRPMIEGDQDLLVLGNAKGSTIQSFPIIESISDTEVRIKGGVLHGLTVGTIVYIYPANITDTVGVAPVAKARIGYAELFSCDAILFVSKPAFGSGHCIAVVSEYGMGDFTQTIAVHVSDSISVGAVRDLLSSIPYITVGGPYSDLVLEETKPGFVRLTTRDDIVLCDGCPLDVPHRLVLGITDYARVYFLKRVQLHDPVFDFRLILTDIAGDTLPAVPLLHLGQEVRMTLVNTGEERFYYQVIDIDPMYKATNLTRPDFRKRTIEEFTLLPGEGTMLGNFTVIPPVGRDVIKVLLSREPLGIDLESSGLSRGISGGEAPLEKIIKKIWYNDVNNTRGVTATLPANSGGIYSIYVDIRD